MIKKNSTDIPFYKCNIEIKTHQLFLILDYTKLFLTKNSIIIFRNFASIRNKIQDL